MEYGLGKLYLEMKWRLNFYKYVYIHMYMNIILVYVELC